jgi:hypothetical protein
VKPALWGVDVSTEFVDVAIVFEDGRWQTNRCFLDKRKDRHPVDHLAVIDRRWSEFVTALVGHFPPVFVFVERPTGRFPQPQLVMAAGVVACATKRAADVPVEWVAVASWKKATGLGGNASKQQVFEWARALGLWSYAPQDAADALGICAYGCSVVEEWAAPVWTDPPDYIGER